jgi:hypothetical protein
MFLYCDCVLGRRAWTLGPGRHVWLGSPPVFLDVSVFQPSARENSGKLPAFRVEKSLPLNNICGSFKSSSTLWKFEPVIFASASIVRIQ